MPDWSMIPSLQAKSDYGPTGLKWTAHHPRRILSTGPGSSITLQITEGKHFSSHACAQWPGLPVSSMVLRIAFSLMAKKHGSR